MGGVLLTTESKKKGEVIRELARLRKSALNGGMVEERTRHIGWDEKKKVWQGYLWMHS